MKVLWDLETKMFDNHSLRVWHMCTRDTNKNTCNGIILAKYL